MSRHWNKGGSHLPGRDSESVCPPCPLPPWYTWAYACVCVYACMWDLQVSASTDKSPSKMVSLPALSPTCIVSLPALSPTIHRVAPCFVSYYVAPCFVSVYAPHSYTCRSLLCLLLYTYTHQIHLLMHMMHIVNPIHLLILRPIHLLILRPIHLWILRPIHLWILRPIHLWILRPIHLWILRPIHLLILHVQFTC